MKDSLKLVVNKEKEEEQKAAEETKPAPLGICLTDGLKLGDK